MAETIYGFNGLNPRGGNLAGREINRRHGSRRLISLLIAFCDASPLADDALASYPYAFKSSDSEEGGLWQISEAQAVKAFDELARLSVTIERTENQERFAVKKCWRWLMSCMVCSQVSEPRQSG